MSITHKFLHTPHPQRRDVLNDLERDYPDAIERTMRSKFRSIEDVATATSFHHHLALLTGRAVPGKFKYRYVDVGKAHLEERVESLKERRGYDFFCLNDVDTAPERREYVRGYVHDFLEWYFPYPSSFERR
ncbi:stealth conserved region 3 domain-containing protein [Streptomyces albogriseolus]